MTDQEQFLGPDVRVCDRPDCHVPNGCKSAMGAFMGLAHEFTSADARDPAVVVALFRQELARGYASDASGGKRMIPDGCEFTVHRSSIPGEHGGRLFMAVYSGPARDIGSALAGAPEYDEAQAAARLRRMTETADPRD